MTPKEETPPEKIICTRHDPLQLVDDPRKDEFLRAYREKLGALRVAMAEALEQVFPAAMGAAKARQGLNKLSVQSPCIKAFEKAAKKEGQFLPPSVLPFEYRCTRVDILLDEAVNSCVAEALVELKSNHRAEVYAMGWDGSELSST